MTDFLTCGICREIFSLGDILHFIEHKTKHRIQQQQQQQHQQQQQQQQNHPHVATTATTSNSTSTPSSTGPQRCLSNATSSDKNVEQEDYQELENGKEHPGKDDGEGDQTRPNSDVTVPGDEANGSELSVRSMSKDSSGLLIF